jgi:hypothetical protein
MYTGIKMFLFDNFLDIDTCNNYKCIVEKHYQDMISKGLCWSDFYPTRNIILNNDPIQIQVQNFIQSKLNLTLECYQVELQTWPIGIESIPHRHTYDGRGDGDYNSLIYLNDDFDGGEFFTENGITLKPVAGQLTFFNGKDVMHGVNRVSRNHRYTLILWWKNTVWK